MEKIVNFIGEIFVLEDKFILKLKSCELENKYKIERINKVLIQVILFLTVIIFFVELKILNYMYMVLFILYLISNIIKDLLITFTTVSCFLRNSFILSTMTSILLIFILSRNSYISNIIPSPIVRFHYIYFTYIVFLLLYWFILSTLCNKEVSLVSNSIISVFTGIILHINSFYWRVLDLDGINIIGLKNININGVNVEQYEILYLGINFILLPIFSMTAVGALGALLKGYWINKNKDIFLD